MARWPEFVIDYRIRVKAKDREAARRSFYEAVCGGNEIGIDWELIEETGFRAVQVVNPQATFGDQSFIQVHEGPYDQDREVTT